MDWSLVLVAAIAAAAPMLAVFVSWNQQRAAMHRVEDNTNGKLLALEAQLDGLKRLRAVEMRQRQQPPVQRVPGVVDEDS